MTSDNSDIEFSWLRFFCDEAAAAAIIMLSCVGHGVISSCKISLSRVESGWSISERKLRYSDGNVL